MGLTKGINFIWLTERNHSPHSKNPKTLRVFTVLPTAKTFVSIKL
ncbi:hypothetical protein VCRA217O17_160055 [Vibrio crassostreae]|nr:hypothetical protein VCRA217O17_160055 [Vibrio crassostreae]